MQAEIYNKSVYIFEKKSKRDIYLYPIAVNSLNL